MSEPEKKEDEELAEGTLMSHLLELRNRLMRAMLAVLIVFIPCMIYSNELFTIIAQPLLDKLPKGGMLIATGVISPFMTPFKLSFFVALFAAMPYVIYQIWAFVAPGLYKREKRFAVPLLLSSVVLFYVGVLFAYFAVFPVMFEYLTHSGPTGVIPCDRHRQLSRLRAHACSSASASPSRCRWPWCCWCSPASSAWRSSPRIAAT